jgi:prolipoprotein diacylglyceryl transferase
MWGFPAGLVGGRIYFDITTPSQVPDHWWGVFAIWQGGLGIWGGIAGGAAGGLWVLHRRLSRADIRRFMDVAAPGLLVAQAIGRIGNYFNQELFGAPSNLPWALQISPAHRPPGYLGVPTFEPTFLYEMIWNLGLAGVLIWLGQKRLVRAPGLFALYVAGYSGFRIFEETQRIDYSVHFLGQRLNFFISLALCLLGLAWFTAIQKGWRGLGGPRDGTDEPTTATAARASTSAASRLRPQPSGRSRPAKRR